MLSTHWKNDYPTIDYYDREDIPETMLMLKAQDKFLLPVTQY